MEYNNADGKDEVLYRWKAGWSTTMQMERMKYYTGGRLDGVQQCRRKRLKYYTGGRLESNAGGKTEVLSR